MRHGVQMTEWVSATRESAGRLIDTQAAVAARVEMIEVLCNEERAYQDAKWGKIADHPHSVGEWILIIEKEAQEAKLAWTTENSDERALQEIMQVYATCRACMEQRGAISRNGLRIKGMVK